MRIEKADDIPVKKVEGETAADLSRYYAFVWQRKHGGELVNDTSENVPRCNFHHTCASHPLLSKTFSTQLRMYELEAFHISTKCPFAIQSLKKPYLCQTLLEKVRAQQVRRVLSIRSLLFCNMR